MQILRTLNVERMTLTFCLLTALACFLLAACASTTSTDPRQQAVEATYKSAVTLDAAITATRGAVRSGALKGQDAQNALKAFEMSMTSLKAAQAALAAQPATPASGAK